MNKDSVFGKTDKGIQEISNRTLDLDKNIRSALIMVDGKTPVSVLANRYTQIGIKDAFGVLQALKELGLIVLLKAGQGDDVVTSTQSATTSKPMPTSADGVQDVDRLKRQIAKIIEEYFGFMATPHLNQLTRCSNRDELLAHTTQCQQVIKEAFNTQKAESFKRDVEGILR